MSTKQGLLHEPGDEALIKEEPSLVSDNVENRKRKLCISSLKDLEACILSLKIIRISNSKIIKYISLIRSLERGEYNHRRGTFDCLTHIVSKPNFSDFGLLPSPLAVKREYSLHSIKSVCFMSQELLNL